MSNISILLPLPQYRVRMAVRASTIGIRHQTEPGGLISENRKLVPANKMARLAQPINVPDQAIFIKTA